MKVGIILDSPRVPAWVGSAVRDLQDAEFLDASLVILRRESDSNGCLISRLGSLLPAALFELYERIDYRIYREAKDALSVEDVSAILEESLLLEVTPVDEGLGRGFEQGDLESIRSQDLDVILHFGSGRLVGEILQAAKFGVWSLQHGDAVVYCGAPPLFWEIYERNFISQSALLLLSDQPSSERVLYHSYAATNPTSLYRSRNPIYWKTSHFVMRRLRDLHEGVWSPLESGCGGESVPPARAMRRRPGNGVMLRFLGVLLGRFLRNRFRRTLFYSRWNVGFRKRRPFDAAAFDTTGFDPIPAPAHRFYADPFLLERGGKTYLFFEDGDSRSERGSISYCTLSGDGEPTRPRRILEQDHHLSYPFVFEYARECYLIPETASKRTVELYKATDFPERWELDHVIFEDLRAVDTTIFEHGGKFWLFTNVAVEGGTTYDELSLYFSNSPLGRWTPHPRNPVVSDVRRARPAGRIFQDGGRIIRPGQDCSRDYGSAITLCEVQILTEREYREAELGRIDPSWLSDGFGVHTLNRSERFEVLDGRRFSFKWSV